MSIYTNLTHADKKILLHQRLNEICQKWREEQEIREGRNDFVNLDKDGEQ